MNLPFNFLVGLTFVGMLCVLIAAHEFGHYLFARWFRMGIDEFSIGVGKPVWTWWRRKYTIPLTESDRARMREADPDNPAPTEIHEETRYSLRPILLMGYVRIRGALPDEDGSEIHVPGGLYNKPPWQRFIVFLAGPMFSFIFGALAIAAVFATTGREEPDRRPILGTMSEGPAMAAGLRPGDRIRSVNGSPVQGFYDFIQVVQSSPNHLLYVEYQRKGHTAYTWLRPDSAKAPKFKPDLTIDGTHMAGRIGVAGATITVPMPLGTALIESAKLPFIAGAGLLQLFVTPSEFGDSVGGPATMVAATADAARSGVASVVQLAGLLSISLGVINLLPLPPLDGGQMLIALIEIFRRGKRLSIHVQNVAVSLGASAVLVIICSVLFVDFVRFSSPAKPHPTIRAK